jgi:5-methyltetrahydropteroyltriglutamate--homocysteine methyltransferase
VQLDEPGFANPPWDLTVAAGAEAVNAAIGARRELCAVHVCFGNNASRPYVRRDFGRLFPGLDRLICRMLLLEFANREMADLERLEGLSRRYEIAAGVVDVKSFHEETAEEVAERIRRVLTYVPAERLAATADCGFSALPRWLAKSKMKALAEGARLVRGELGR